MLSSGVRAPEFEVQLNTGEIFRLKDIRGTHHLVLIFYPKDFTHGCTREVCGFRNHFEELSGLGAVIIGVSRDPLETHKSFARRHALPFPLASDPDLRLSRLYDVVGWGGLWFKRVTFLIDKELVVRGVLHHEILVDSHWQRTLGLLRTLNGASA